MSPPQNHHHRITTTVSVRSILRLKTLYINENGVGDDAVANFKAALENNEALTDLDLLDNSVEIVKVRTESVESVCSHPMCLYAHTLAFCTNLFGSWRISTRGASIYRI
jgi:hypothetical protein